MYGFIQGMWNCISKFYSWISPLIAWLCAQITYHSTISNIFQMNWANSYMFPVPHPMWSHTYIHCIEPSIHVMDSYLLVWIISMPASNSRMLVAVQKTVAFAKLQWKSVGMAPLAEKSCKLLSKTLRMYEPLRFSLSVWPPGSKRIWNSSIYKQKSRFTYIWNCSQVYIKRRKFTDTIKMLAIYVASCNLRTDNIWFWDALHQVSHVFHPFLAFFCCLCGKKLITTCADDLKLVQPLNLGPPFCFNLLNM